MRMNILLTALISGLAFPAFSADFTAPPMFNVPAQESAPRWSGFYAGIHGGWAHTQAKLKSATGEIAEEINFEGGFDWLSDDSFIFGVTAGYNIQRGSWVFGPEFEIGYMGGANYICEDDYCDNIVNYKFDNVYGLAAARVGFATESILFYGKGGLALAKISHSAGEYDIDDGWDGDESVSDKSARAGLALGAGLEYALSEKTSLKAEYIYMNFGKKTYSTEFIDYPGSATFTARAHTVKFGLNYKF